MGFSTKISSHIHKYEWCKHSLYRGIKNNVAIVINLGPRSVEMATKLEIGRLTNLISNGKVKTKTKQKRYSSMTSICICCLGEKSPVWKQLNVLCCCCLPIMILPLFSQAALGCFKMIDISSSSMLLIVFLAWNE